MKLLQARVMRGPNFWSNYRKNLIVLKLDLEDYKNIFTNQIPNFNKTLNALIPTLETHRCSKGKPGGFCERLNEGTLLGHVLGHLALELQTLAGMDCGYGRARETDQEGVYNIIFSYRIEKAGLCAAKIALNIINTLISNKPYTCLENDIEKLKLIYADERLGPSTEAIIAEAEKRNIPVTHLNESTIMLGYGCQQRIISGTITDRTGCIGVDLIGDKDRTKELLASQYIPVPQGRIVRSMEELEKAIEELDFPLVIKPRYGNHGRGITTDIKTKEKAVSAFNLAKKISWSLLVERFIEGFDYRFLIIDFKFVAAAKRIPAHVIGDGKNTIEALINTINEDPFRGNYHENILTKIKIDEATLNLLEDKGLSLSSVLKSGEIVYLKQTANISTGGVAIDVTDEVHPDNIFLLERAARLINIDVCGIDLIAKDISLPIHKKNGAILEINAAPGFRMHLSPFQGQKREVAKPFVSMLFPKGSKSRIPVIGVTGTNGKTTVVRLIAHIASFKHKVGMATTEGIYIDQHLIYQGDCSGPRAAQDVLRDPRIDFAVLECARGGILRSGLGFDHCSTSILTNISEDHLGQNGINDLHTLTKVKSVLLHSTLLEGYAILNADNPFVYRLKNDLHCATGLFGLKKSQELIDHYEGGGLCCFLEDDIIYITDRFDKIKIINVKKIPLAFNGTSHCMIQNILAAILACWVNQFTVEEIVQGLNSFMPDSKNLPGRFNIFDFEKCSVLLDYAHNEEAYLALLQYVSTVKASRKICIIAGTGDRRNKDIKKTGYYAAQIFDEIIIRFDEDSRGRDNAEIINLVKEGIYSVNPHKPVKVIGNEFEAITYAIDNAAPNSFIWYFPEKVLPAVDYLTRKRAVLNSRIPAGSNYAT